MGRNDTLRLGKWMTRGLPAEIRVVRTWGVFLGIYFMLIPFASGFSQATYGSVAIDSLVFLDGTLLVIPWSRLTTKRVRFALFTVALICWLPLAIGSLFGMYEMVCFAMRGETVQSLAGIAIAGAVTTILVLQYFAIRKMWRYMDTETARNRAPSERTTGGDD